MSTIGQVCVGLLVGVLVLLLAESERRRAALKQANERQARMIQQYGLRFLVAWSERDLELAVRRYLETIVPAGVHVADVKLQTIAPGEVTLRARMTESRRFWR